MSLVRKHSVSIRGHRTSYSLEQPFADDLAAIAQTRGLSLAALVAEIDENRPRDANLSSAIRIHVLAWAKTSAAPQPDGYLTADERNERMAQGDIDGEPAPNIGRHARACPEHLPRVKAGASGWGASPGRSQILGTRPRMTTVNVAHGRPSGASHSPPDGDGGWSPAADSTPF